MNGGQLIMGYSETWKSLEKIIIELRKKGITTPETVMTDLKAAKTMIKLMDAENGKCELSPQVEQYLKNVEAYLITEAQKHFAPERIDEWLRQIDGTTVTSCSCVREEPKKPEESRFIPGVPRDQKWVRVTPIDSLSPEKLKQLAEDSHLALKTEKDGHLIAYGRPEDIRDFVKKMTTQAAAKE
jgi:hypothetical protein